MEDRYIMAIDLGTAAITLTVAKVEGDNTQIVYSRQTPSDGIRYSRVINPARAGAAIRGAIDAAEAELGIKCNQVVTGYPKYEVLQKDGSFSVPRNEDECVTADDIRNLRGLAMDSYRETYMGDSSDEVLLGAVAQSFNCGQDEFQVVEKDVIGMTMKDLEGNFKLFIGQSKYVNDMDIAFKRAGDIVVTRKFFTPEATAKAVLFDSEMENGVALIDLGAGVTSVSIYYGNVMRHYSAIPFGGRSITMDIKTICAISEKLAENIKLAYGACMPDRLQNLGEKTLQIRSGNALPSKQVSVQYLSQIITARATEIIEAILYEIQDSGFADNLRSGVVITGGGANLANISTLIREISGYNVRIGYPKRLFAGTDDLPTEAAASAGLILMAKEERCRVSASPVERPDPEVEPEEEQEPVLETVFDGGDVTWPEEGQKKSKPKPDGDTSRKKKKKADEGGSWRFFDKVVTRFGEMMDEKA